MKTYNAHETDRMLSLHGSPLASFTRRGTAFFIDIAIAAMLFGISAFFIGPLLVDNGWIKNDDEIIFALNLNWYSITWTVLYFSLATYWGNGKTVGKRIMKIRTVSLVHKHISLWHSLERALGYGASTAEFGFGFIQYFIHPNKRTLHDKIAETIVIKDH